MGHVHRHGLGHFTRVKVQHKVHAEIFSWERARLGNQRSAFSGCSHSLFTAITQPRTEPRGQSRRVPQPLLAHGTPSGVSGGAGLPPARLVHTREGQGAHLQPSSRGRLNRARWSLPPSPPPLARRVPHALPRGLPEARPVQPGRVPLLHLSQTSQCECTHDSLPGPWLTRDRCRLSTGSWGPRPDTA